MADTKETWNEFECGDEAALFGRGLASRGFKVEGVTIVEGEIKGRVSGGVVKTTAPKDVFDAMVSGYRARPGAGDKKKK